MNKLAVFVEGQTEGIFVEHLARALSDEAGVAFRVERMSGGRRPGSRRVDQAASTDGPDDPEFFVLIVDCGQDERVKSDILDRYQGLVRANYEQIVGIQDVHPQSRDDIKKIRDGFDFRLPNDPIKPSLILAIMEIEAWFLAEHSHFPRIHSDITIDRLREEFGFDPSQEDMQLRDHPCKDLKDIYFLERIYYDKSRAHIERTVGHLDFSMVQNKIAKKIDDLGNLVRLIRNFFNTP